MICREALTFWKIFGAKIFDVSNVWPEVRGSVIEIGTPVLIIFISKWPMNFLLQPIQIFATTTWLLQYLNNTTTSSSKSTGQCIEEKNTNYFLWFWTLKASAKFFLKIKYLHIMIVAFKGATKDEKHSILYFCSFISWLDLTCF